MKVKQMLGYKLFRIKSDNVDLIRIVDMKKYADNSDPIEVTIRDESTKEKKKVRVEDIKEYTPLEPDGICTFSTVHIKGANGKVSKDVIVTASKYLEIKLGLDIKPYCVCRQSVTDIFHSYFINDENNDMVGLSVSRNTMPANFDFGIMLACDDIIYSDFVNFYRTDTLDDILDLIKINKFNRVLEELYNLHVEYSKNPALQFKDEDHGWCKNLKKLLELNSFQYDINEMLGIIQVDFKLEDYIKEDKLTEDSKEFVSVLTDDVRYWLSLSLGFNISSTYILEFDHDINLADFNDTRYLILRSSTNKTFIVVYTIEGEFKEEFLNEKALEMDFSTKFRLSYMDKNVM